VSDKLNTLYSIRSHKTAHIASAIRYLLKSAERTLSADQASAKRLIIQAIALLQRDPTEATLQARLPDGNGGLTPWQVRRVSEFVGEHLASPLPVATLASVAKLSGSHFSHVFKQSFGVSPYAYVMHKRIAKAQELMLATDEPLGQIALNCGLADQSHFCHTFRRLIGNSPAARR
jgi:AraC-like DNA-binding protein